MQAFMICRAALLSRGAPKTSVNLRKMLVHNRGDCILLRLSFWLLKLLPPLEQTLKLRENVARHIGWSEETALMAAAANGSTECAVVLLERGTGPDIRGKDGNAALDYAKDAGNAEIIKLLQEHGQGK